MNFQLSSEYICEVPSIYIQHYVRAHEKVLGKKFKCACVWHTHTLLIFITFKDMSLQLNRQIPAIVPILDYIMLNEMGRNCKGRIKCMLSNKTQSGQTVSTSTCSSSKDDTKNQYTIDPGVTPHCSKIQEKPATPILIAKSRGTPRMLALTLLKPVILIFTVVRT